MSTSNAAETALERIRVRLQQLQGHHQVLLREINSNQPLVSYAQLQSSWNTIQATKMTIIEELKNSSNILSSVVVVPNARFPKQSKNYLDTLLRTKFDPSTEDWVEQKQKDARERDDRQEREKREGVFHALPDRELTTFWRAAAEIANSHAVYHGNVILAQADYTWEEVDGGVSNVRHGLRRELREPMAADDSDEDVEEDDMDEDTNTQVQADQMDLDDKKKSKALSPSVPHLTIESIQRLMARGECQYEEKIPDERGGVDATKSVPRSIRI